MDLKPTFKIKPNFIGRKVFHSFDIEKIIPNLNIDLLIIRFFRVFKSNSEKYQQAKDDVNFILDELRAKRYILTKGVYGIFEVKSDKDYFVVKNDGKEYVFPLQKDENGISISSFLNENDYVGFTSVSCFVDEDLVFKDISGDDFKKIFLVNSVNIMLAEAFTEVLHYMIIEDMGLENKNDMRELYKNKNLGRRYSPGYPGLDISLNKTIHELLNAKEIGSGITESYMIDPESSVQSIVIYNNKAFHIKDKKRE